MPTGHKVAFNWKGQPYMPLRLKLVLAAHGIVQADLWRKVLKLDGAPISASAGDGIINWNDWPKKTPAHSIKTQVEAHLAAAGVPTAEVAGIWLLDEEDGGRGKHPAGVHALQHKSKPAPLNPFNALEDLEIEMLSPEAKVHFSLPCSPFHGDPKSRDEFYVSADVKRMSAAIDYACKYPTLLAAIGAVGSGKTTLYHFERERLEASDKLRVMVPACVRKQDLTAAKVIDAMLLDLDPAGKIPQKMERRIRRLRELLTASIDAGNNHLLMIEEAHDMPTEQLKELKRIWELSGTREKLFSILLIAQEELLDKLSLRTNYAAREFILRCEIEVLRPFDRAQLEQYLAVRLKRAGKVPADIFDKTGIDGIMARLVRTHDGKTVSSVYPLVINVLVTKALNYCAELALPQVSAAVFRDL
jgi:type II secretory pathway predicted ATPase ExeA